MAKAVRSGAPVAVALLDLDHVKRYNDTYGHPAGDRLLKEAAAAWRERLRPGDLLARYGGEEFGVLLPGVTADEAAVLLDRMRTVTRSGRPAHGGAAAGRSAADGLGRPAGAICLLVGTGLSHPLTCREEPLATTGARGSMRTGPRRKREIASMVLILSGRDRHSSNGAAISTSSTVGSAKPGTCRRPTSAK
ncbi:hypothetical protein J2S43_002559 [Catenuloplanes nepalensis]|uniref:GGDEF domain-containing protein n=2 Tax=Catenuloplanes nepalensis TaxID=587533 RepID=A0ABT9MRI6_9ACTN|nr:GGDEF domain-containing protein [Catenuloplanes nepalensis]MDP9794047.1 hypothetical protein [Catenuloplanes nepalensis]